MSVSRTYAAQDAYWSGRFAAVTGEAAHMIEHKDALGAKKFLRETLAEFIASDCPHEDTRRMLRPYLGGKK